MQNSITYSCTALQGKNKKGVLKPDEDGYYHVILGALDVFNSAGQFYPFDTAKHIFENSSSLMRRLNKGQLRGECGHPKQATGQTMRQFIQRVLEIRETNISHHIKEVTISNDTVKDNKGRPVVAILGKVKPAGPQGEALEKALQNPDEDVAFSIRSLTNDEITRTSWTKHIKTCVTFDWVNEPGIQYATKYNSPGLESQDIDVDELLAAEEEFSMAVGMEDEDVLSPATVRKDFGIDRSQREQPQQPRSLEW